MTIPRDALVAKLRKLPTIWAATNSPGRAGLASYVQLSDVEEALAALASSPSTPDVELARTLRRSIGTVISVMERQQGHTAEEKQILATLREWEGMALKLGWPGASSPSPDTKKDEQQEQVATRVDGSAQLGEQRATAASTEPFFGPESDTHEDRGYPPPCDHRWGLNGCQKCGQPSMPRG